MGTVQLSCSLPRQVGATYKTLWTKGKANAAARMVGQTKKRYRGPDREPRYVSPTPDLPPGPRLRLQDGPARSRADAGGVDDHALHRLHAPCGLDPRGAHLGVTIGAAK